jgi:hypothetical protein
VCGKGYEGYIFDENHIVMLSVPNQKSRYTPTKKDIEVAENLLKEKLPLLNKDHINQIGRCPIIEKNLKKYKRLYVGFENYKGDKILWINFVWDKEKELLLSKEIIHVLDGCSYYWNIKVNISTGEVFDLNINGVS